METPHHYQDKTKQKKIVSTNQTPKTGGKAACKCCYHCQRQNKTTKHYRYTQKKTGGKAACKCFYHWQEKTKLKKLPLTRKKKQVGRLPVNATGALKSFIVNAKERLVVEQGLRLIRAHAHTSLASLAWLVGMCDVTHGYVWRDSFT